VDFGIRNTDREFIAVWRLPSDEEVFVPLTKCKSINLLYPKDLNIKIITDMKGVKVKFGDKYMAAINEINK